MAIEDSNPHDAPVGIAAEAAGSSRTTYMFSDLPVGTELDAEQMMAIGCGPPTYKTGPVAYTGDKYLAPEHLACVRCREAPETKDGGGWCWIMALKVAEEGGLFDLRACHDCVPRKCSASTRSYNHLIALTDPYTVVVLDRKGKALVRIAKGRPQPVAPPPPEVEHDGNSNPDDAEETIVPVTPSGFGEKETPASPVAPAAPVVQATLSPITVKLPAWSQVDGKIVFNNSPTASTSTSNKTHEHELERAAWEAQRTQHLANEAAWAAQEQEYESTIAALRHDLEQQYESTIAGLKHEVQQHARKEAAWTGERVQYAVNEARLAHEREVHAQAVAGWQAERAQFATNETRWAAERNHLVGEWQKVAKDSQSSVAAWRVQQESYERHITMLEANAVKDRAAMFDRLADAERALVGLRAALGMSRARGAMSWDRTPRATRTASGPVPAPTVSAATPTYLFANRRSEHLTEGEMTRLCGEGTMTNARGQSEVYYPAPPKLVFKHFRAVGGGVLEVVACFECFRLGSKCSSSSRRTGVYVAFTDWGAEHAVLVDREGDPIHRVTSEDDTDIELASDLIARTPSTGASSSPEEVAHRATARAALDRDLAAAKVRYDAVMAGVDRAVREYVETVLSRFNPLKPPAQAAAAPAAASSAATLPTPPSSGSASSPPPRRSQGRRLNNKPITYGSRRPSKTRPSSTELLLHLFLSDEEDEPTTKTNGASTTRRRISHTSRSPSPEVTPDYALGVDADRGPRLQGRFMAHAKDYEDSLDESDEEDELQSQSESSDEAVSSGAEEDSAEEDYDARDVDPDPNAPSNLGANYRTRGERHVPTSPSNRTSRSKATVNRTAATASTSAEPEFLPSLLDFIATHKDCHGAVEAERRKHAEEKAAWDADRARLEARVAELEAYRANARQAARELVALNDDEDETWPNDEVENGPFWMNDDGKDDAAIDFPHDHEADDENDSEVDAPTDVGEGNGFPVLAEAASLTSPSPLSSLSSATSTPPQNPSDPDLAEEDAGPTPSMPILVLPPGTPKDLSSILRRFTSDIGRWSVDRERAAADNSAVMDARERRLAADMEVVEKEKLHLAEWSAAVEAREKLLATKAAEVEAEKAALETRGQQLHEKEMLVDTRDENMDAWMRHHEETLRRRTIERDKERALRTTADANLARETALRASEARQAKAELNAREAYWKTIVEELEREQRVRPSEHAKSATASRGTRRTADDDSDDDDDSLPEREDEAESTDADYSDEEMDFDAMDGDEEDAPVHWHSEEDDHAGHRPIARVLVNVDRRRRELSTSSSLTSLSSNRSAHSTDKTPTTPPSAPATPATVPPPPAQAPPPPPAPPAELVFPTNLRYTVHLIVRLGWHAWNLVKGGDDDAVRELRAELAASEEERRRLAEALQAANNQAERDAADKAEMEIENRRIADNEAAYKRANKRLALERDLLRHNLERTNR
ncbi:uncharacterized protein LOC62_05G006791 [Vanrija pseudolonga]|uniref:Uncharacterized protein n=1 Tax=Vanrija pseudolonga TaxID=143232 RepID=A0AAF1BNK7_9TREE|nr:hypothetical protein LOC62_05G006791 [Vanrija pseudolonga]